MNEILAIDAQTVKIGKADGTILEVPFTAIQYQSPAVGDHVKIFETGDQILVSRDQTSSVEVTRDGRRINKIVYVLLAFFLGGLGVHRFMRGQIGLGIMMLLFNWLTLGIWSLVDFIISLVKLSAYDGDDFTFDKRGKFTK